ncbi:MAG: AtpZ/AtpI family protein [Bacteroidota bacterium]
MRRLYRMPNQLNQKKKKKTRTKSQKTSKTKGQNPLKEYAKYSHIGFQMLAIIFLAVFGGLKLDELVDSIGFPLFTLVGSILGVVLAIYFAIKDFIRFK